MSAFAELVRTYINGVPDGAEKLARRCECAVSTVERWARGVAIPGHHVQNFVNLQILELTMKTT